MYCCPPRAKRGLRWVGPYRVTGPVRIGPRIWSICIYFFADTTWIRIRRVSVSDTVSGAGA
uniref:Uncharacterized protein n=1 Tax=Arundo donax TaxID=35708 RepID=A0A0A9BHU9_ARUDO